MTLLKGVGIGRFSDVKQIGNHSLETQQRAIERAAAARGYQIVEHFADEAVSAYRRRASQRSGMMAMKDYVLTHDIEAVFFFDESRVTRQVTDFVAEVWAEIRDRKPNVKFFSASESDTKEWDPMDMLTQLRLVIASEESRAKSRRAVDSQRMMLGAAHPKRPGSRSPYGFDMVDGVLVPNQDAPIVYFIFHLASWGYGDQAVADILNHAMVPSPGGGVWNASTIDLIINHKAHLGHLSWNVRKHANNSARKPAHQVSLFENVHDPIIPPYLWETVHGLRYLKKDTGLKLSTTNFLDGIAICKACNIPLKAKDQSPAGAKGQYVKYLCSACGQKVNAGELHGLVSARVSQDWGGHDQATKIEAEAKRLLQQWQRMLKKEREQLRETKEHAMYGLHSQGLTPEVKRSFEIALNHVSKRLQEVQGLENRVNVLLTDSQSMDSLLRFGHGAFEHLSDVERRTFLLTVLDSVKVSFGQPVKIAMEYRLSPYVALTRQIGHLTESGDAMLGEKPKAQ